MRCKCSDHQMHLQVHLTDLYIKEYINALTLKKAFASARCKRSGANALKPIELDFNPIDTHI